VVWLVGVKASQKSGKQGSVAMKTFTINLSRMDELCDPCQVKSIGISVLTICDGIFWVQQEDRNVFSIKIASRRKEPLKRGIMSQKILCCRLDCQAAHGRRRKFQESD
jgi:hypothetical protein